MINLVLAILFSSLLYIVFKFYSKFNINTFQAIVFNYVAAFLVGIVLSEETLAFHSILNKSWLFGSFILGGLFILVFNILGKTSQENGVSVASVSSKMSMIIPILFGIFFFKESITLEKIIGIGIALIAVYFTSKKEAGKVEIKNFIFPILLFFGAGIVDTSMNYLQHTHLKDSEIALFSATTFLSAFFFGILISVFKTIKGNFKFEGKNIIGGIALGVPNYFSMYFLIKALHNKNLESATVFTLINIGVILLSTVFGIILFKEKLLKQNYLGIALAIIAVILVTL
ncbi:DMT family transporter [uncultured Flavobacterium sp.]|uniref:DMT family transporter n=1 Tax=uncultured Flavobacterium sp. TaxID=165435 RepID=UPI0030EB37D2|tara:strand:- start:20527 stop:21384 length:858 start_codon:yes stop_codon:yes gene_type:complete